MSDGPRVVIVGGGPAAKAAAEAYRDEGGRGPVTILSNEERAPYNRPPLTKDYLRGETGAEELPLENDDWYRARGIELALDTEVAELDLESQVAGSPDGGRWEFDLCLLATGSRPVLPSVPGIDRPEVHTVRRVADSDSLAALAGEDVVVVGSGFIGCEVAASLAMRGSDVTMATLEQAPQVNRLGEAAAERIAGWLERYGVEIAAEAELAEIAAGQREDVTARFADGREEQTAGVLLALGIERNDELAGSAGLEVDDGLPVDASMRSASPCLFAAGDVALAKNAAAGRHLRVEHWGEALNQGQVAGCVMAGAKNKWNVAPGFWSTIGEHTLKYAGWGDGWDHTRFESGGDGAFTAWYGREGELVGVLAHDRDADYERGRKLIEERTPWS